MGTSSDKVFRAVAIERAASPEQLDHLVEVTRPLDWIMVGVVFLMLATVTAWSVVGRIPSRSPAEGILVRSGARASMRSRRPRAGWPRSMSRSTIG